MPHLRFHHGRYLVSLLLLGVLVTAQADTEFDHFSTGFPITGLHVQVSCEGCHKKGVFKGTPQDCNGCHNGQVAPGKPSNHVLSTGGCDNCHATFSWNTAALDHSSVMGSCRQCHDGGSATDKPNQHINTAAECDSCHGTISWIPVSLDHDAVLGTCRQCHNGVTATGMHNQHIQTIEECDVCHSTRAWSPATGFDHSNAAGRCNTSGCHANDKPNNHIQTVAQCDECHKTSTWLGATFDHESQATGPCRLCHIKNLPSQHLVTASECDACHSTLSWSPVVIDNLYVHTSMNFPGKHNSTVTCDRCHPDYPTNIAVDWRGKAFGIECASCHTKQFNDRPRAHIKIEEPETFYQLSELTNCTNDSCHLTKSDGTVVQFPTRHFSSSGNF